jgi:hypothetical protein
MNSKTLRTCGTLFVLIVCLLIPASYSTPAYPQLKEPPKVLWILQEQIKPTTIDAFQTLQQQYISIYTKAKFPFSWLGLAPIADRRSEIVFLWGFNSVSDMEGVFTATNRMHAGPFGTQLRQLDKQATALVTGQVETVSTLRSDLSVRGTVASEALRTGGFMQIQTIYLQPGKEGQWTNAMTDSVAALNKSGTEQPSLTYQVTSGDAPGTFLIIYPSRSPDEAAGVRERQQATVRALGSDKAQQLAKVISETVQKEERNLYAIDPRLSFSGQSK